jgi:hypothetical protein
MFVEENGDMTESQLIIAVAFVTEMISLGVIVLAPHGVMLKGHQHQSCAADPIHMTCPEEILPRMYPGDFSSVIDASKFFYMFLTVDEERKFMGVIHPDTG